MLYHWYELGHAAVRPARVAADSYRMLLQHPFNPMTHTSVGRHAVAALEVFERTTRRYDKPAFGITSTDVDGETVQVREETVWSSPFCKLVHFRRELPVNRIGHDPRILLVAPMSGHFATLLRGTVETFLPDHEVYITDWQDARGIPMALGGFDLDDYIATMREIFTHFHGDVHVFAVCQPSVPVLAATALMDADGDPNVPLTLTLAGGPIDTRVNPTVVNRLAEQRGTEWFRRNVISTVPWPNPGAGRSVYPGFLQLSGFMTMNLDRHLDAHKDLFFHLVEGDGDSAEKHRDFYDEYLAVMDLTAEFFLQTVDQVFVNHQLPRGVMMHRGRLIDLGAIRRTALLTIEGEKDDITGVGQCGAAIDLCKGIPRDRKSHYVCPGVGHYGVFNGSRFRRLIAPRIAAFARANDPRQSTNVVTSFNDRRNSIARSAIAAGLAGGAATAPHAPDSAAFTFDRGGDVSHAAADAAHPMTNDENADDQMSSSDMASLISFKLWRFAGSWFLDSISGLNPGSKKNERRAG